jgi:acyl carrier protein
MATSPSVTTEETQDFLLQALAKMLNVEPADIDTRIAFDRYGLDSAAAVKLTGLISKWSGIELEPTLLYDCPTIDQLTAYLVAQKQAEAGGKTT